MFRRNVLFLAHPICFSANTRFQRCETHNFSCSLYFGLSDPVYAYQIVILFTRPRGLCAVLNGSKKFTRRRGVYRLRDHHGDAAIKNSGGGVYITILLVEHCFHFLYMYIVSDIIIYTVRVHPRRRLVLFWYKNKIFIRYVYMYSIIYYEVWTLCDG